MRNQLDPRSSCPAAGNDTGVKVVSTVPGKPFGIVAVFDGDGACRGLVDGPTLTAIRTAAGAGLATRLLARPDARTMAMLGAGAMAFDQIVAIQEVRPILDVLIWSRDSQHAKALASRVGGQVAADPSEAVSAADIVSTATPSRRPLFAAGAVRPGTHINAVGAFTQEMCEIPPRSSVTPGCSWTTLRRRPLRLATCCRPIANPTAPSPISWRAARRDATMPSRSHSSSRLASPHRTSPPVSAVDRGGPQEPRHRAVTPDPGGAPTPPSSRAWGPCLADPVGGPTPDLLPSMGTVSPRPGRGPNPDLLPSMGAPAPRRAVTATHGGGT